MRMMKSFHRLLLRVASFLILAACMLPFLSAPAGAQSQEDHALRVGIVGDQYGSLGDPDPVQILEKGLALLKQKNVQIILHTGDLIEGTGQPAAEYQSRFARMAGILDSAKIPWYLTPGDHDVNPKDLTPNSNDRSIEKLFFANYRPKRAELSPALYYGFDVGSYHFIALNSLEHLRTDVRWGDAFLARLSEDQSAWLEKDLSNHRSARGIIVFMHQPLWYNVAAWQPVHRLLRKYPVRAVIAGHMHYDQDEGEIDGIRYLIVGATGGKVKLGSSDSGNAQMVTVMTLDGKKVDFTLIPIGSDSPQTFATRLDMDRIQALDQALDALSAWQWEPANALCISNGALLMKPDNSPGLIRLRAIGNPVDVPVRFAVRLEAEGLPPTQGKFKGGICGPMSTQECILTPGATSTISNLSAVEFRWPSSTENPDNQNLPPLDALWEAALPASGVTLVPGATLHIRLKYSFPVETGAKYVEQDVPAVVQSCSGNPSPK